MYSALACTSTPSNLVKMSKETSFSIHLEELGETTKSGS